jgi:hypothetical protein
MRFVALPKVSCLPLFWGGILLIVVSSLGMGAKVWAEEPVPVFELDCISFAGRFLANAPVKKKVYPGLAVDGTSWALAPDDKGAVVTRIFPGEAAEKAGVEAGDQIISVNGYATAGMQLRDLFAAYHMYEPDTLTETLVLRKKDGSQPTLKLQLVTIDKCGQEERTAWLDAYKGWGY